jgi:hypothetical protein
MGQGRAMKARCIYMRHVWPAHDWTMTGHEPFGHVLTKYQQRQHVYICVMLTLPSPPRSSPTLSRAKYDVIDTIDTFLIQNSKVSK